MQNAKDYNPLAQGLMVDVIGPPGSGKSHFAKSALEIGKGFGLITPTAEVAGYAGSDFDYEVVLDPEWRPTEGKFVATGYKEAIATLTALEKLPDPFPYKVIIVDTASALADSIGRSILAPSRTDNPQELANPFSFYTAFRNRMLDLLERLNYLRYAKKAHVIVCWHEDVREVEGFGQAKKEMSKSGTQVHWDVAKTALLPGSTRNDIGKYFDLHLYAEPVVNSKPFKCKLQVLPTSSQLAKTRLQLAEAIQKLPEIPNDFPTLLKLVEERYGKR
jgi:hypothetical protein